MDIIRQESFMHLGGYPLYTLYLLDVSSKSTMCAWKQPVIMCQYGESSFNLFAYESLEQAEHTFDLLVNCRKAMAD